MKYYYSLSLILQICEDLSKVKTKDEYKDHCKL